MIRVPSDRSADPARSADPVDRAGHPRPGDPAGLVRLEPVPWLAEVRPIDAAEAFRSLPGLALLESARPGRNARWTFLTADPIAVLTEPAAGADPFAVARRLLARLSRPGDEADTDGRSRGQDRHGQYGGDQRDRDERGTRAADRPPFIGGLVGYLGYELGDVLERLPAPPADDQGLPLLRLALHDWAIAWDRRTGTAWLGGRAIDADASRLDRRLTDVRRRLAIALGGPSRQSGDSAEARAFPGGTRGDETQRGRDLVFRSSLDRGAYEAGVEAIRDEIARGSIYQANLTRRLETPFDADPWPLYRRLRTGDPALFSAYLDLGTGAPGHGSVDGTAPARPRAILSASPEPFLSVDASGRVSTDPIKGTRPRGRTRDEDRALARELLESAKDRAENVMIVDVLRNDLGRVCRPGTVRVPRLCRLERTVAVQHLVSTITGQLAAGRDAFDLLAAAFPGGSITGAPKIRAQEILRSLEPTRRGPYTGTLGWIGPDGAMAASILIRTYVADGARLSLHVGGGITARSVPAEEWAETVAKAHGPLDAIGGRELADPIADREVAAAVASTGAA